MPNYGGGTMVRAAPQRGSKGKDDAEEQGFFKSQDRGILNVLDPWGIFSSPVEAVASGVVTVGKGIGTGVGAVGGAIGNGVGAVVGGIGSIFSREEDEDENFAALDNDEEARGQAGMASNPVGQRTEGIALRKFGLGDQGSINVQYQPADRTSIDLQREFGISGANTNNPYNNGYQQSQQYL